MAEKKEITVEQKLKSLYKLQTMLSEIDKIKTLRGELPLEVEDLEDELAGLSTRMEKINKINEEIRVAIAKRKNEIEIAQSNIQKYQDQQNNVRNNREYDMLSKEIEFQTLEIELAEKRIREANADLKANDQERERCLGNIEDVRIALEDKRSELNDIVSETRQEEDDLRDRAKSLEVTIEPRLLKAFKRIRQNCKNGLGVVYVQRDACGGCFNKIPPQRQLDIRSRKKVIVCEYCGRILIDAELAGVTK